MVFPLLFAGACTHFLKPFGFYLTLSQGSQSTHPVKWTFCQVWWKPAAGSYIWDPGFVKDIFPLVKKKKKIWTLYIRLTTLDIYAEDVQGCLRCWSVDKSNAPVREPIGTIIALHVFFINVLSQAGKVYLSYCFKDVFFSTKHF